LFSPFEKEGVLYNNSLLTEADPGFSLGRAYCQAQKHYNLLPKTL